MNILVLSKEKKHPFQTILSNLGTVLLSDKSDACDICITSTPPTVEQLKSLGKTPILYYIDSDPISQDIDAFLYSPTNTNVSYTCILLPEIYINSKSYLETRYPNVPIKVINPLLIPYPNKLYEGKREETQKINICIRASNESFYNNSWRQLCIAEHMFHTHPELINDIYLFNAPSNKCAIDMFESLDIFKKKKLRNFIDFEFHQIVQHFNRQNQRTVYLTNSVSDKFDPLALYFLQNQAGVVHTSDYLRLNNLGKFYNSYDIDTAVKLIAGYAKDSFEEQKAIDFCKKFSNTQVLLDTVKSFSIPALKCVTSKSYNPKDISIPLAIGYDNNPSNDNCKYFVNTLTNNNWEHAIISVSDSWNGLTDKILGMKLFLDTLSDDKVIVISDTRDVVCCRTSKQFIQGFKSKQKDFIVSMELFCFNKFEANEPRGNCVPLTQYWNVNKRDIRPLRKFVNSGLLCGKVSALKRFYTWVLEKGETNDQLALGKFMNVFPELVYADIDAELLHSSLSGINGGVLLLAQQKQDSPTFAELFGRGSFFLHIPGQTNETTGQNAIYKYIKTMLDAGASEKAIHYKDYPDVDFNGNFVDGSKLIIK